MKLSIPADKKENILHDLQKANLAFQKIYPGDRADRQPVHTVYGGANLFKSDSMPKMGKTALKSFLTYAPDFTALARIIGLEAKSAGLAHTVYNKIVAKLEREAVEDFRIDFEDGF